MELNGKPGREPRPVREKTGFFSIKGVTVIELMIVLLLAGVIAALSYPSYRLMIEKRRLTSGAEQMAAFLSEVQSATVKQNQPLALSYKRTDSDTWCLGYTSGTELCDCSIADPGDADACAVEAQLRVLSDADLEHPDILKALEGQDDGFFVYDPVRGLMADHTDSLTLQLDSENGRYELSVEANATGRVRVCSRNSEKQVPGYEEC